MSEKYIKVNRPLGEEQFKAVTAFDLNGQSYVVVDSKLKDANQNIIVYVSRIVGDNLEEIIDEVEWANVKNTLITIVKGIDENSIKYISSGNLKDSYNSSQNVGHTLALPDKFLVKIVDGYSSINKNEAIVEDVKQDLEIPILEESINKDESENVTNNLEDSINKVDVNEPVNLEQTNNVVEESVNNVMDNEPIMEEINNTVEQNITISPVIEPIANESIIDTDPINLISNPVEENISQPISEVEEPVVNIEPINNMEQPVIEQFNSQSVIEEGPIDLNTQPNIIETPIVNNDSVELGPIVTEQNNTNSNVCGQSNDEIEKVKNEIVALCERLQAKEKEASEIIKNAQNKANEIIANAQKEADVIIANAKAKEQIAEIAFNNAQRNQNDDMINIQDYQPVEEQGQSRILG